MSTPSPCLLSLPIEIRVRIYQLCFLRQDPAFAGEWVKVDSRSGRYLVKDNVWPIFRVCQQVYSEIMPEYYASTEFHFTALSHLRAAITNHTLFRKHARHIVLSPVYDSLPSAQELLDLTNLQIVVFSNMVCHEPIGTPRGDALQYATLKSTLDQLNSKTWDRDVLSKSLQLQVDMTKVARSQGRDVRMYLRFRYSYVEKAKHPDGWGGSSAKRSRIIDYDCTFDTFNMLDPDCGEAKLIMAP